MNADEIYTHLAEQSPRWGMLVTISLTSGISFKSYWVGVCWDGNYIRLRSNPKIRENETTIPFEQFANVTLSLGL